MRDPCNDGNVLYLDYINVNILVILYFSFARYYRWENYVRGQQDHFILFLTIAVESTIISK